MEHPYTQALLDSIPRLELPSHTPLHAIPGRPPEMVDVVVGCRFAPRCPRHTDECDLALPPLLPAPTPAATPGHLVRCIHPIGATDEAPAAGEVNH